MRAPSERIAFHARVAAAYIAQAIKRRLTYKGDFLAQLGASILSQLGALTVVYVLFLKSGELGGWNRNEAFFLYGFSMLPMALFGLFSMSFYRFSERYLVEGQFDRLLLRPLETLFQLMLESFELNSVWNFFLGLGLMAAAWAAMDPHPVFAWWYVAVFPLMLLGAAAVITGVFLALTAASFWMTDRVGILPPVYNFMQFGRYPLTIYRPWIQVLLSFVLPFGFAAFYPASFFVGRTEFAVYFALTPAVGVLVFFLGYGVWRAGVRRYESTGT